MENKESNLSKNEIKLLIELEKIKIEKIKLSSRCRLKELVIKKEIAIIYRSKKHLKKAQKEINKLDSEALKAAAKKASKKVKKQFSGEAEEK